MLVTQSCPTLCNPWIVACQLFCPSILQARILEWVAIPFSRGSSQFRDWNQFSCIAVRLFTIQATRKDLIKEKDILSVSLFLNLHAHLAIQSCPTLCDPVDCNLPDSSVHGIIQARILEWVALSSSRGSSWTRDWTYISCVDCIGRRISFITQVATWEAHLLI